MKLQIGTTEAGKLFTLPADAVTQTFGILARKGAGKTNTGVVMAEEMLDRKNPIVVLDPLGCWHGLRSDASGTKPGYPILIMGGEHGDVPLTPESGAVVADFLVKDRVPTILDVSMFGENQMRRFVGEFADRFYRTNRDAVHWFVDEADEFAPQQASGGEIAKCLGAMQNIVRRGRARGIGVTLISQRSAVLSKSVLTQTECLIALQTTGPQDLKAIGEWIKYHADAAECERILSTLPRFQRGEAWVYSPGWLGGLQRVKVRARHTFDTSGTPKAGETRRQAKTVAEINLDSLSASIRKTVEEAKANDPAALRRRIAELERARPVPVAAVVDQKAVERAFNAGIESQGRPYRKMVASTIATLKKARVSISRVETMIADAIALLGEKSLPKPNWIDGKRLGETSNIVKIGVETVCGTPMGPVAMRPSATNRHRNTPQILPSGDIVGVPKGERAILIAAASRPSGVTRTSLTVMTGYKRSTRDAYIQRLREKGHLADGERITATPEGIAALGDDFEPLPTGAALWEWHKARLPEGERRVVQAAVDVYPDTIGRERISELTEYKRSTRDAYIQRASMRELIEIVSGGVKASDELFD